MQYKVIGSFEDGDDGELGFGGGEALMREERGDNRDDDEKAPEHSPLKLFGGRGSVHRRLLK